MGERFIGVGHPMGIFTFLDCRTAVLRSILQLTAKPVSHRVLMPITRGIDDPADRKRLTAIGANLDRHLIRRTTNTARTDLYGRANILERIMEDLYRISAGALGDGLQRTINDTLRG